MNPFSNRPDYTRRRVMYISRATFALYFLFSVAIVQFQLFEHSALDFVWLAYLVFIYVAAECLYAAFLRRGIDLSFALPLMFVIYLLNLTGLVLGGQEELPLLNRAEHFTSFVLLGYVVWIFFVKYLPQQVWQKHQYYTALLALSVTSALGVGNEIVELLLDAVAGTQTVGSGYDTSLDLLMNTLGAGLFLSVRLILNEADQGSS